MSPSYSKVVNRANRQRRGHSESADSTLIYDDTMNSLMKNPYSRQFGDGSDLKQLERHTKIRTHTSTSQLPLRKTQLMRPQNMILMK
jgi:hypothetical protein